MKYKVLVEKMNVLAQKTQDADLREMQLLSSLTEARPSRHSKGAIEMVSN